MVHDEIYWTIISYVIPIAQSFMEGYCLYRLAKPFMKKKKGIFCVGVIYSLTMLMLYMIPLYLDSFIAYSIGVFAAFLVMCRIDRRNYEQKAFIVVIFFSLRWFTSAIAEILYDNIYNYVGNTDYMIVHPNISFALYVGVCLLYLVLEFLFTAIGIWCILKNYAYKYAKMSKKELLMLAVPSFLGVAGYEIIWCYRNFYIAKMGKNSDMYDVMSLLYYAVAIITIVVVIVLYQSIKAGQKEKLQNELLATQMDSIRQHIEQVENLYQSIRSIKHDMTNHVITLERLYAGNKVEEAKAYSTELKTMLAKVTDKVNSGNPVTDVILQEMQSEAGKRKIRFNIDYHYPTDSNVNAFDMSVILHNALQNAMENAGKSKMPYISILSYRRNNAYMIEIKNSFEGNLKWDVESGLPVTSKENLDGHGYGLSNIRRMAEKYSGDIAIDLNGKEFCLSIMLMMEI